VEDSQDDYLFLANFADGNERQRWKRDLARSLNTTDAPQVRKRLQRARRAYGTSMRRGSR